MNYRIIAKFSISSLMLIFFCCACPRKPEVATYHLVNAAQMAERSELQAREAKADAEEVRKLKEQAGEEIRRVESKLLSAEKHIPEAKLKLQKLGVRFSMEGLK